MTGDRGALRRRRLLAKRRLAVLLAVRRTERTAADALRRRT
jgi:hypothetical protein